MYHSVPFMESLLWKLIGGGMGNQTLGITPAHHYTHSSWDRQESHWGTSAQRAGIYLCQWLHDSFTNCDHDREYTDGIVSLTDVFSPSGKFCIIWKSSPPPATHHTSSLTFSLISNVSYTNNIYVLYFVSFVYKIVFYMLFTLDSMGRKNNVKEQ